MILVPDPIRENVMVIVHGKDSSFTLPEGLQGDKYLGASVYQVDYEAEKF